MPLEIGKSVTMQDKITEMIENTGGVRIERKDNGVFASTVEENGGEREYGFGFDVEDAINILYTWFAGEHDDPEPEEEGLT